MDFIVVACVLFAPVVESVNLSKVTPFRSTTTPPNTEQRRTTKLSLAFPAYTTRLEPLTSIQISSNNKRLTKISMRLEEIPEGYPEVETLNVGYNNIDRLPPYVFWNNSYANVGKIYLQQNRIQNVSAYAFKGLKQVKHIDISNNLITTFDPYTFKGNNRLQKLILTNNLITFSRLQTFLLSHSIEHLVLSDNKIDQVYDMTFLGLPNLKSLILSDNAISSGIAPYSFRTLDKLHYLSLTNTGVYRLGESMFSQIPRTITVGGTPLGLRFEPPLTKVTGESVTRLLSLSRLMIYDKSYFKNPN